jgi:tetratricopeptide (TPR) repeat protein
VVDHRPGLDPGQRPRIGSGFRPDANFGNRPVVGLGNRPDRTDRYAGISRGLYANRRGQLYVPGYAHYHGLYSGWHHGYWANWNSFPWLTYGANSVGWMLYPGDVLPYSDPYYTPPATPPAVAVFDYSQPIPVADSELLDAQADEVPGQDTQPAEDANTSATAPFDAARQAFLAKQYEQSLQLIDKAIPLLPGDPTMHEFRALVLFALQRYQEAAATLYPVLAVGPGWDWQTMRGLYPDDQTFTDQLRALEQFAGAHPQDAACRFVLAYHYLVLGYKDAAAKILKQVVALEPRDQLSARLLQQLQTQPDADRPAPGPGQ